MEFGIYLTNLHFFACVFSKYFHRLNYSPRVDKLYELKIKSLDGYTLPDCHNDERVEIEMINIIKEQSCGNNAKLSQIIYNFLEQKYVYRHWFLMVFDGNVDFILEQEPAGLLSVDSLTSTNKIHHVQYLNKHAVAVPFNKRARDVFYGGSIEKLKSMLYDEDPVCAVEKFISKRISQWLGYISYGNCPNVKKVKSQLFCQNPNIFLANFKTTPQQPAWRAHPTLKTFPSFINEHCPNGIVTRVVAIQS